MFNSLITHHSFKAALKSIDWADVLHAAIAGGLNGMLPGLSQLSVIQKFRIGTLISAGNVLLNAEFDYNTHNEKGRSIKPSDRFQFGGGKSGHEKDPNDILKEVLKGSVGILLDATTHLTDKISAILQDKFGLTKQITNDGTDEANGVFISDIVASILGVFHEAHLDKREDQLIDRAKPSYKRSIHRRNTRSHNIAKRKNHKQHPRGKRPQNINFRWKPGK